jgi:uncharacterized protein YraI
MRRTSLLLCFTAVIAAAPAVASAASAYVTNPVNIFAGPGNDYPLVASLAPGVRVNVQGCLSDYSWCDVTFSGNRGWVYAGELAYPYRSGRVPIVEYGPRLGLPVISFSLGNYWDHYYRGRPWYHERSDWARHYNDDRWRNEHRNDWHGDRNDHRNDWHDNRNDHRNDWHDNNRNDNRGRENRSDNREGHYDSRTGLPTGRPGTNAASRVSPDTPGYYGSQQ